MIFELLEVEKNILFIYSLTTYCSSILKFIESNIYNDKII